MLEICSDSTLYGASVRIFCEWSLLFFMKVELFAYFIDCVNQEADVF